MSVKIYSCIQGSPEWHELRKNRWTGSKAIKLLLGKPMPNDSSDYQSDAMMRGSLLEHVAIQEYTVKTKKDVLRAGFVTNSKYPNAGYSPDGIVGKTLLEVKCLNGKRHEDLIAGKIPLEYLAQIYFGMVICELKKAQLLAFNPEYEQQLTIIDVPEDKGIMNNIRQKLEEDMRKQFIT
jgi:hypothetical protein